MRKDMRNPRKKNMSTHQMCSSPAECSWASCASSSNSSVTRNNNAAMLKEISPTWIAGEASTAAAVVAPRKPPSHTASGGRRMDTRNTLVFCCLSEAAKVRDRKPISIVNAMAMIMPAFVPEAAPAETTSEYCNDGVAPRRHRGDGDAASMALRRKLGKCSTLALMHALFPYALVVQTALSPFVDPPGLFDYEWTTSAVFSVAASGLGAFLVNYSGFLVVGHLGAMNYVLLGQAKSATTLLVAALLFGTSYTARELVCASSAMASIVAYAYLK